MKIISLGFTCYIKSLIQLTKYASQTDFFDWMNSFSLTSIILCIENNGNIFDNIIKSPIDVDVNKESIYYNTLYNFRLPHEKDINISIKNYKRRFERLINYRNINNSYIFIRIINMDGRYGCKKEELSDNYNQLNYDKLIKLLPINSKILLFTHIKLLSEDKIKIYNKFIIIDDIINPEFCFYGDNLKHKDKIIECYNKCFEYIDKNFHNLNVIDIQKYISNKNIFQE